MKKMLILLIIGIAFKQIAISQSTIGLKVGMNISYQREFASSALFPQKHINFKSLPGYQFGAFYKLKMNKQWTISSEPNFSLIGSKIPYVIKEAGDSAYTDRRYNATIGYLEVPLVAQYNMHHFYVGAGPAFSFRVLTKKLESVSTYDYKTLDVSGNVLAGYKIAKKMDINVRYSYGLLNTIKDQSPYGEGSKTTLKNRFLNVSLLYALK